VSYIRVPQGIDANSLFLVLAQSTSLRVSYPPIQTFLWWLSHASYVGTLLFDEDSLIPTVTDNLFSEGTISAHQVAVSFEPLTEDNQVNGELTFGVYIFYLKTSTRMLKYSTGGTDRSKYTGEITYAYVLFDLFTATLYI
jgi:hypothetical protein